jgi:hypothetical protein
MMLECRTVYFFAAFLALRAFLPVMAAFAPAPSIAKSLIFFAFLYGGRQPAGL